MQKMRRPAMREKVRKPAPWEKAVKEVKESTAISPKERKEKACRKKEGGKENVKR